MADTDTILIVEDSRYYATALAKGIETQTELKTMQASTMAEALTLIDRHKDEIFLALLDLSLPDASGNEVVEVVGGLGIPIVVFSGSYDESVREWLMIAGVIDFVVKENPGSVGIVISLVRRLHLNRSIAALVVDDSRMSRLMLAKHMTRYFLQVHEAQDGQEALRVLKGHPEIRLVVTDHNMPNMTGYEFINHARARASKEDLAIIGLSSAQGTVSATLLKAGANDFIHKPFIPEEFYCRVAQSLDFQETFQSLRVAATTDYLTGVRNRRAFYEQAKPLVAGARRGNLGVAVAILDVDKFKRVNDEHGHHVGDQVLKRVAVVLARELRETDIVGRLGGEEFGILLAGKQDSQWLLSLERVRAAIENERVVLMEGSLGVTASIGVSTSIDTLDNMLKAADQALYEAKETGRNRVIVSQ